MQSCLRMACAILGALVGPCLVGAPTTAPAPKLLPLHAQGRQLRDAAGKVMLLRGVNLGGWLVTEAWMCGQTDEGAGRGALEQLEKRFGPQQAATLMSAWQEHWLTTADLDAVAGYGCNLVRVPFSYRTLQDAAGNWRRDERRNVDFSRMDWLVREAQQRGLYVIFDLHTWPGEYHAISRLTPEGQASRAKAAAIWAEVARHYRGVASIAAFDVVNEPEGSPGNVLQKAMYDAIRGQDAQRVLIVESVAYPSLRDMRWQNVVWSAHYPENAQKAGSAKERLAEFDRKEKISATPAVQVPIFIGEAKAPEDNAASAEELGGAFNALGWSWTVWTYKGVDNGGWASANYDRSIKYSLEKDPYETILDRWTTGLTPSNLHPNEWWIEGFGRAFKGEGAR